MFKISKKTQIIFAVIFFIFSGAFYYVIRAQQEKNWCKDCGTLYGCIIETTVNPIIGWHDCDWNKETQRCDMDLWGDCKEDKHPF